mmetsp:Transcript_90393/g.165531  ORF Transcript_90393/g.165531 Transcript_90393/m.165531 type:complete len:265 (+) Transcript_90393:1309-2103(+)
MFWPWTCVLTQPFSGPSPESSWKCIRCPISSSALITAPVASRGGDASGDFKDSPVRTISPVLLLPPMTSQAVLSSKTSGCTAGALGGSSSMSISRENGIPSVATSTWACGAAPGELLPLLGSARAAASGEARLGMACGLSSSESEMLICSASQNSQLLSPASAVAFCGISASTLPSTSPSSSVPRGAGTGTWTSLPPEAAVAGSAGGCCDLSAALAKASNCCCSSFSRCFSCCAVANSSSAAAANFLLRTSSSSASNLALSACA